MENKIEELQNTLDSVIVEIALNTAHLKTLTIAFHELSAHLLSDEQAKNLKSHYYHTLNEKSTELLNHHDLLCNPVKASKALFELHCFVEQQLKEL
jgi:hypothetical protein